MSQPQRFPLKNATSPNRNLVPSESKGPRTSPQPLISRNRGAQGDVKPLPSAPGEVKRLPTVPQDLRTSFTHPSNPPGPKISTKPTNPPVKQSTAAPPKQSIQDELPLDFTGLLSDEDLQMLNDEVDSLFSDLNLNLDDNEFFLMYSGIKADGAGTEVDRNGLSKEEMEIERNKVINELVETEQGYVNDLQFISRRFCVPIREKKLLSSMDAARLFSNIEILLDVNTELLKKMEQRKKSASNVINIGDVFLAKDLEFMMSAYTGYCNDQTASLEILKNLTKKSSFAAFLKEVKEDPESRSLELVDFLAKPMQRICKYPLLFKEILKWTTNDHSDHQNVHNALLDSTKIVDSINASRRESENLRAMLQIENCLLGAENLKLTVGTRKFFRSGDLLKVSKGRAQQRQFWLFSDMLLYARPHLLKKNQFDYKGFIPLNKMVFKDLPDADRIKNAFSISRIDKKKTYVLFAKNDRIKLLWMQAFTKATAEAAAGSTDVHSDGVAFKLLNAQDSISDEDHLRMMEVQTELEGYEKLPTNPKRRVLKEGQLELVGEKSHPSHFFLFDDHLVYAETQSHKKKRYLFKGSIPMGKMVVVASEPSKVSQYCFDIVRFDTKTKLTVGTQSQQEKEDWISSIEKLVDDHLAKEKERQNQTYKMEGKEKVGEELTRHQMLDELNKIFHVENPVPGNPTPNSSNPSSNRPSRIGNPPPIPRQPVRAESFHADSAKFTLPPPIPRSSSSTLRIPGRSDASSDASLKKMASDVMAAMDDVRSLIKNNKMVKSGEENSEVNQAMKIALQSLQSLKEKMANS